MRILISGATGFIGTALIKRLHQEQHQLTVLSRDPQKAVAVLSDKVDCISQLQQLQQSPEAIINLAGEPIAQRWTVKTKQAIRQSRWQLTEQLSRYIQDCPTPPSVFISGSAIGYYGTDLNHVFTETSACLEQDFPHQVCQQWEQLAMAAQSDSTRVCCLRTGLVLGKNGGMLKKMRPAFRFGLGGKMGSGQQWMSWIHIDDVMNAIVFLLERNTCHGPYNLCTPAPVTNQDFCKQYASSLHRPCLLNTPEKILALGLGEMAMLLTHGQQVQPQRLLNAGFHFTYPKLSQALKVL